MPRALYAALLLIILLFSLRIFDFILEYMTPIFRRFKTWIWRKITNPQGPPWKRNHIGLNHGRTKAVPKTLKIGTLVLPNYKTAL